MSSLGKVLYTPSHVVNIRPYETNLLDVHSHEAKLFVERKVTGIAILEVHGEPSLISFICDGSRKSYDLANSDRFAFLQENALKKGAAYSLSLAVRV